MLEIIFEIADLADLRFAISPMDHVLSGAAQALHFCVGASVHRDRWWRRVRNRVPRDAAPLLNLVNASAAGLPDFLAPDTASTPATLDDELDAMLSLSDDELRRDLEFYGTGPRTPRIVDELRDGGSRHLRRIAHAARAFHQACLAPDWPGLQRALQADIAGHSRTSADAGIGSALGRLHPDLAWDARGVLRYADPAWDLSFGLDGRGLVLRPNHFLARPTALLNAHRAPVLLYPIGAAPTRPTDGLTRLLGPARARALRAIGQGPCTTGQLTTRLGVSAPSASTHATALREAGIITTEREGRRVRHSLTRLGHDLLAA
ncbi:DNA-binding transcriptional ArsR family regulator [Kitasatospora gansuensis]|uniref:DNA-binding transcriptional ArsR family regulator n=1 Tax=Kitasatospora gansuensis TaxID=258050 RepID=A0A7W7S651_9ACTN|nr:winged helix-turn-helix domain-containing protein [Kitasatospora gansuensis]MBB4944620.1 DNA-binding transcriptional ArsR family regulator [Kitasatospora gansuensis]